jgi:hypothetical protein
MVPQRADTIAIYVEVSLCASVKIVCRYDSGAGHQIGTGGKAAIGELARFALEFGQSSFAPEHHYPLRVIERAIAADFGNGLSATGQAGRARRSGR